MTGNRGSGRSKMFRGLPVMLVALAALPGIGQAASISGQGTWETTLLGRDLTGDGVADAYYDTVLNITWLADTRLARSNNFRAPDSVLIDGWGGKMSWLTANGWIDAMNTANYLGYDRWRLPTLSPINGTSFNGPISTNGTTDRGTATTTTNGSDGGWRDASGNPVSELGHMYYVNLGNLGFCDPTAHGACDEQPGYGLTSSGPFTYGLTNSGPFPNLQDVYYWSGVESDSQPGRTWFFDFSNGNQNVYGWEGLFEAWAVLDGEVTPVPLPAAGWLFLSALGALGGLAWRRQRQAA